MRDPNIYGETPQGPMLWASTDPLALTPEKIDRRDAAAKAAGPERFRPLAVILRWLRARAMMARIQRSIEQARRGEGRIVSDEELRDD